VTCVTASTISGDLRLLERSDLVPTMLDAQQGISLGVDQTASGDTAVPTVAGLYRSYLAW
jgi:hypothetical protein